MATKVIILLMFAALAQSSTFVPNLRVSFGLPDTKTAVLESIIINQEAARVAHIGGSAAFFDTLHKLAAGLIVDSTVSIDVDDTEFEESLCSAKNASEITYDSIILAAEESCSAVESAQEETYSYIENVFTAVSAALELAKSGDYSENQAEIESYQSTVQENFEDIANAEYDTIVTCLNITETEALDVIAETRAGSILAATHLTEAIFNAIKSYAGAVSGTFSYATLVCDIEGFLGKASIAHRDNVEFTYTMIRTVYINKNLDENGVVGCVAQSQYTDIVSFRGYKDGNIVLFDTIDTALKGISLGLGDDGTSYVSKDDISLAAVIATFDAGDFRINDYLLYIHPDANATIATSRTYIHSLNVEIDQAFYDAVHTAENISVEYSTAVSNIETLRHAAVDPAPAYTNLFFTLFRNNLTYTTAIENALDGLQNKTIYGAQVSTSAFLDAVLLVVNGTHFGNVTEADFTASESLKLEAYYALEYFTQGLAAAGLLVCNYLNGS